MFFHWDVNEGPILFEWWRTTNSIGIISSMIGIIIFAALHEGIKNYREHLFLKANILSQTNRGKKSQIEAMFCGFHIYQTIIHMIQFTCGYILMFIFMSFNIWLGIAVVFGSGFGYWLFAWNKFTNENTDCCR
ncbi:hypothetical protein HCN44_007500 [Aphidius gifuensis]|uniref:Copper transport protein n=2 Tax=Aphidius gifuensis TaxID=684658 RepID=A0A834XNK5_APHGI|nr:hypothetical protein HCN44_007500 [Aphidius gifuensis]